MATEYKDIDSHSENQMYNDASKKAIEQQNKNSPDFLNM